MEEKGRRFRDDSDEPKNNNEPIDGDNYGPLVMKYVADTWTVH